MGEDDEVQANGVIGRSVTIFYIKSARCRDHVGRLGWSDGGGSVTRLLCSASVSFDTLGRSQHPLTAHSSEPLTIFTHPERRVGEHESVRALGTSAHPEAPFDPPRVSIVAWMAAGKRRPRAVHSASSAAHIIIALKLTR